MRRAEQAADPQRRPEVGAFFDARAARYDAAYDARSADGHALRARMNVALSLVGNGPGDILDAGMGPGRLVAELERHGWLIAGVDCAEEMVALARRRLPEAGERLLRADIERLPFEDASFDAVVATGVLEYSEVPVALSELERVLRAGGRAIVSYPNPRSAYGLWKTRFYYRGVRGVKFLLGMPRQKPPSGSRSSAIERERFEDILAGGGLRLESVEYASFLPVLSPLELIFPATATGLAERLEGRGPALGRVLATQIVYAARKDG